MFLGLFFMVLEHLEDYGRFCSFLGALKVTPAKWPKSAKKVIQSFSKFACHHFIAIWGCPQNLKKIEEVRHFHLTFSVEWPLYFFKLLSLISFNYLIKILISLSILILAHNDLILWDKLQYTKTRYKIWYPSEYRI